ncbi:MAG: DNA polymerase III subunit epsilon [Rhodoferax sp.]|nr:DNA polymerase III subunit epsilon [Rhodoferax sp.]
MTRQIFLDTETTGLYANQGDRIIEIGCVELVNRKLTGNNLHVYVNPGRDSHEEALKVHGITTEFLRDKPPFQTIVSDLLVYLQGAEVIIHNASFDIGFLNAELALAGREPFSSHVERVVDTLLMAKELFPGKRNSLDALCDRLGVDNSGRKLHGALLDAELLADVYICLTRGQDALLIDAGSSQSLSIQQIKLDLRAIELPVLSANAQELAAHEDVLVQIDKASGGKTLWRKAA